MIAISKEPIREFSGRILGWVETDKEGNQEVREFYGSIIARYDSKINVTRDFYGKILSQGNTAVGQLYNPSVNPFYGKI